MVGSIGKTGRIGAGRGRCGNDISTILMYDSLKKYILTILFIIFMFHSLLLLISNFMYSILNVFRNKIV